MKTIILLTSLYPYGNGESFISEELKYLPEYFNIFIIPTSLSQQKNVETKREIPKQCTVIHFSNNYNNSIGKIIGTLIVIFHSYFWKEIIRLIKQKRFNIKNIRTLLSFISSGENLYNNIKKEFIEVLYRRTDEVIIYSYWMLYSAYTAAKLSHIWNCKSITRCHGGDIYEEQRHKYLPLRNFIMKNITMVYPISEDGYKYLTRKYPSYSNIQVMRLGTTNTYYLKEYSFSNIIICTCSYLVPLKRVPQIANALCLIKDWNITWVHFGDGEEHEKLMKAINCLPSNIKFIFNGNVSHDEVINFYINNDVYLFINYSTSEGIPVSIMEAYSFGIPAIATDVGGTHEIVKNEINGVLIPANTNISKLSETINIFLKMSPQRYLEYRRNAYRIWSEKFNACINFRNFFMKL